MKPAATESRDELNGKVGQRGGGRTAANDLRSLFAAARGLLADAGVLERGYDFTAAVARVRDVAALLERLPSSCDELPNVVDLAAEIEVEAAHFKTSELAWRRAIAARGGAYVAREVAALR
jgi:hypothetical protein